MVAAIPSMFGILVYKLVIFELFNSYDILYELKSDSVEDFLRVEIFLILNECLVVVEIYIDNGMLEHNKP